MTPEEHQAEHVRLHRELDELLACYLSENKNAGPRRSVHDEILALLKWSKQKAAAPSPAPGETGDTA